MAHRPFVPWPHPALRMKATEVVQVDDDVRALWEEMLEAMYAMPGQGVGLAAPQLGVSLQAAVVDARDGGAVLKMANPILLSGSEEKVIGEEASPNLPGVSAKVIRFKTVTLSYLDTTGMRVRKELVGLWARSAQHQLDHLEGRMYFDRLSRVKRDMLLRKARKCA